MCYADGSVAGIPDAPEEFGPYVIYERLGLGGMATVHRAKKTGIAGFERGVALKRLLSHLAEDAVFVESFIREAKVASLLLHPNIAQIYDFGRIGGIYYIAMEHVDGFDVRKLLRHANRTGEPIPLGVVMSILIELCDALEYAHTFPDETGQPIGIVHRDVSPSNLIVASTGHIKVIDFGIAKASSRQLKTESGRVKGKLGYMSPEAAMGNVMGPVSDMFSVGVVAHELLTARPLFSAKTDFETMLRIREGEIYPPSRRNPLVSQQLDDVVLGALERDAYARIQTAGQMRAMLEQVATRTGLRHSVRDVAEYAQSIPRGDEGRPSGAAITNNSPFSRAQVTGPSPLRPSRPPPAFQAQPDDDNGDVWADDQPNPLPLSAIAAAQDQDFSVPTNATANLRPNYTPPQGRLPMQSQQSGSFAPQPSQPSGQSAHFAPQPSQQSGQFAPQPSQQSGQFAPQPSQQFAPPPAPQQSSKAALVVVGALLLGGAGVIAWVLFKKPDVAPPATVSFAIEPSDAVIDINGKSGAFSTLELPAGMYSVSIHKPGYKPWTNSVTLTAGSPQNVAVTLDRGKAHLVIDSTPPGLGVTLDGTALGSVTPFDADIATGDHVLAVRRGNDEWTQRFTADLDGTYKFAVPAAASAVPDPKPDPHPGKHPKVTTHPTHEEPKPPPVVEEHPVVTAGSATEPVVPTPIVPKPIVPVTPTNPEPTKPPARVPVVAASAVTKISGEIPTIKVTGNDANADVLVKVCIDEGGRVTSASVKKASPEIAAQMQSALMAWRYKPYLAAGVATPACFALALRVVITHG